MSSTKMSSWGKIQFLLHPFIIIIIIIIIYLFENFSCCFASNCVPSLDRTTASFQSNTEDSDQSLYFIADTTRHIWLAG